MTRAVSRASMLDGRREACHHQPMTYRCDQWQTISIPGRGSAPTSWLQRRVCSADGMRRVVESAGRRRDGTFSAEVVHEAVRRGELAGEFVLRKAGYETMAGAKSAADAAARRFMRTREARGR